MKFDARRISLALVSLFSSFAFPPVTAQSSSAEEYSEARLTGMIRDPRVQEISGIVRAHGKPGYFWVHNDSDSEPHLYLVHLRGSVVSRLKVTGAAANDWEDIAIGPGPVPSRQDLDIADTGNNERSRKVLSIDRILHPVLTREAPSPVLRSERAARIAFRYPDGVFDCEALVVHPKTGDIYLFTKNALVTGVYRLRSPRTDGSVAAADQLTVMRPGFVVTAADLSPQGDRLLLRTYLQTLEYRAPEGQPFEKIFFQRKRKLPVARRETQSEAIAFVHGGKGYVTSDEGSPAPLHVFMRVKRTE